MQGSLSQLLADKMQKFRDMRQDLAEFVEEYEKHYRAFRKSEESMGRISKKIKDLMGDINAHSEKIERAKRDEEDLITHKGDLENEIERAIDSKQRMEESQESLNIRIEALKKEILETQEILKNGSGWTEAQKLEFKDMQAEIDELKSTAELAQTEKESITTVVNDLMETVSKCEHELHSLEKERNQLKAESARLTTETQKAKQQKSDAEKMLTDNKSKKQELEEDLKVKFTLIEHGLEEIQNSEKNIKLMKAKMEYYLKQYDGLFEHTRQVTLSSEETNKECDMIRTDVNRQEHIKAKKLEEIEIENAKAKKLDKQLKLAQKKLESVKAQKIEYENQKDDLKLKAATVNEEIDSLKSETESHNKKLDELSHEKDILDRKYVGIKDNTTKAKNLAKIQMNTRENLLNEISGFKAQCRSQRIQIEQLEYDIENYTKEHRVISQRYLTALEEVKLQEQQVQETQHRIFDSEKKLKQQQNLYEAVRGDRNLYSKQLVEAHQEINAMHRRFKIMNHQIDQLKEEITQKDCQLVQEHFAHHGVEKQKDHLSNEMTKIKKQIQSSQQVIHNQQDEIRKLNVILQEADEELSRQRKELSAVTGERDRLGQDLIKRRHDLREVYEKLHILESTLKKGETQFNERVKTIHELEKKLSMFKSELEATKKSISNKETFRTEILNIQGKLQEAKLRTTALLQELSRPINVHRWRKLKDEDPQRKKLIEKIVTRQRDLINETDNVLKKDLLIQEQEQKYIEMRNVLARQPHPAEADKMQEYRMILKDEKSKLRKYQQQRSNVMQEVDHLKQQFVYVSKEMDKVKKSYFKQMDREAEEMDYEDQDGYDE
eukprot:TRINITY_DN31894_c0_g1_i1.p1 TRINITY_DN31894_c0_g1~~TRINITY_DN31894_c0_g1_i1.p1  ORF type:complete len:835 (-),score=281.00 TRINITY_DN31894_c0_g1_i1:303-2807(-)